MKRQYTGGSMLLAFIAILDKNLESRANKLGPRPPWWQFYARDLYDGITAEIRYQQGLLRSIATIIKRQENIRKKR